MFLALLFDTPSHFEVTRMADDKRFECSRNQPTHLGIVPAFTLYSQLRGFGLVHNMCFTRAKTPV